MKKLSIFIMILAALVMASCDRTTLPGGETPVGDATLSVKVAGTQTTRATTGEDENFADVAIEDLTVLVFEQGGNAAPIVGEMTGSNEVIEIPVVSGETYNIYVVGNNKGLTLDATTITKEADLIDLTTDALAAQQALSGSDLTPTVTGYFLGATMKYGKNYLGYKDADVASGNVLIDGTGGADQQFNVHRLISRVYLKEVKNENDSLTITAVSILNAKTKSRLFPATPAGNNTSDTPADLYYNITFPEAAGVLGDATEIEDASNNKIGSIWDYTSYAHGTLTNHAGGTRFPRVYWDATDAPIDNVAAAPTELKALSGSEPTQAVLRQEFTVGAGDNIDKTAFYLFANDAYLGTDYPGDQATVLLIEGEINNETVYYPIVINKSGHGTNSGTGADQLVQRNREYIITATIKDGTRGVPNPWLEETASLDVLVTVSSWVSSITQDVIFD